MSREKGKEKSAGQGMKDAEGSSVNLNYRLITKHGTGGKQRHTESLMKRLGRKDKINYPRETLRYID